MKRTALLLLATMLLAACTNNSNDKPKGKATAKAQSAPYELLVVADKEWLKEQGGQVLLDVVAPPIKGLPQEEPAFRVTSVAPASFNSTFKTYSKIVMVDINKKNTKPSHEIRYDVYCRPQIIITLKASDDIALINYLRDVQDRVLQLLNEQEFTRERQLLKKHHSGTVMRAANEMFGLSIYAPEDIDQVKRGKNFLWASASKQEFRLNVCIYTTPFGNINPLALRDSVMKINIPGNREDQWMETDERTVSYEERDSATTVMRGLWDMRNDAMGGPFVSYHIPDYTNQRVIIAEGFIYAPNEKKRPLIRKLEAMLQTISKNTKKQ